MVWVDRRDHLSRGMNSLVVINLSLAVYPRGYFLFLCFKRTGEGGIQKIREKKRQKNTTD